MKKILLLFVMALCVAQSFAQQYKVQSPLLDKQQQVVRALLQHSLRAAAAKTTGLKERVIAYSGYVQLGPSQVLIDSTRYTYTGSRGSSFNYQYFDYVTSDPYMSGPLFSVPLYTTEITQPEVYFDTAVNYQVITSDSINVNNIEICNYDNTNNLVTYYTVQSNVPYKNVVSFAGPNQPLISTVMLGGSLSGPWDTSYFIQYHYNATKLISDSITQYINTTTTLAVKKDVYVYDTAGNITEIHTYFYHNGIPYESAQYQNTYTASNQLQTVNISLASTPSSSLAPYISDTFAYTPGVDFFTYYRITDLFTGDSIYNFNYHIGANNLPDTLYTGYADTSVGWQTIMQVPTYDSYNNPVKVDLYPYIMGFPTAQPSNVVNYYYEEYNDVSVPPLTTNSNIKVYPNPTTGNLTIDVPFDKQFNTYKVHLLNATGQVVLQQNGAAGKSQLSTAHLLPGIYWLRLTGTGGGIYHQTIVKE